MGLDFIHRARKSVRRGWTRGLEELQTPNLFTREPSGEPRTIAFQLVPGSMVSVGDSLLVRLRGDNLLASRENLIIAQAIDPPQELISAIRKAANCAVGTVTEVHRLSRAIGLAIS